MIELSAHDRRALRAVYDLAQEAFALMTTSNPTKDIIIIALGLSILDRLTDSDDEDTR